MSRLECTRCKCVYADVVRVRKCPLCGNTDFAHTRFEMGVLQPKKWFRSEGTLGFYYISNIRMDSGNEM